MIVDQTELRCEEQNIVRIGVCETGIMRENPLRKGIFPKPRRPANCIRAKACTGQQRREPASVIETLEVQVLCYGIRGDRQIDFMILKIPQLIRCIRQLNEVVR